MSDYDIVGYVAIAVILLAVFAPTAISTWLGLHDYATQKDIDKIRQAETDCLIKEYYYMDAHREFCDMIGVKP